VFAGSVAKDEYVRDVQAELLAPPPTRGVLRDKVVAERKIVYLQNVGQGSSGLEVRRARVGNWPVRH
jgi:hypothetical protein